MLIHSQAIYDEGRAAKQARRPDSANPYRAGSQNSLDWLEGYTADERPPGGKTTSTNSRQQYLR